MEKIYVIGDSHVNFFGGYETITWTPLQYKDKIVDIRAAVPLIENFFFFHLGGVLAYNLNKYGSQTLGREKIEFLINSGAIPRGSKILCVCGEVDMRIHVFKQVAEKNIPFEVVADEIAENYMEFLKTLKNTGGGDGISMFGE